MLFSSSHIGLWSISITVTVYVIVTSLKVNDNAFYIIVTETFHKIFLLQLLSMAHRLHAVFIGYMAECVFLISSYFLQTFHVESSGKNCVFSQQIFLIFLQVEHNLRL